MKQWSIQTCPRSVHPDWSLMSGPSRTETLPCPWCALGTFPADHPSTVYREGDEVEVTVRGELRLEDGAWVVRSERGSYLTGGCVFDDANREGRVRLVKAAAPTYEPGTYSSASTGRWVLYPQPPEMLGQPWLHIDARPAESMWHASDTIPADLRPCDVVPREATP